MYPTYAAVLQVVPASPDCPDPEEFRLSVRESVEEWVRQSVSATALDRSAAAPGELRTIELRSDNEAVGEIREVAALGDIPWAWLGAVRRPLPCPAFPDLDRTLVTQLQMRTVAADEFDAPPVDEVGYKVLVTIHEHVTFPEGLRSPGSAAEMVPPCDLVERLVNEFRVFQGGIQWTKSYSRVHDERTADALYQEIVNPRRAVPLVVTVGTKESDPPIPPAELGARLFGIARVVHIEKPRLTGRIRERLGDIHRIGWGVIRVYRSHFQTYDTSATHPFFLARDIEGWRAGDFVDYLASRIERGETVLVDDDSVVLDAFQRVSERSAREARASINEALSLLREVAGGSTVESLADDIQTLTSLYGEESEARQAAEADKAILVQELEDLRHTMHLLRVRIQALETTASGASQQALPDISLWQEPATLHEALDQAMQVVDDEIVILDDVWKSIDKVQGISPRILRDKLHTMFRVVRACRAGRGDGRSPGDYFGDYGIELKTDISETARHRYQADYKVRYTDSLGDHEEVMGPHIDLSERHRIYWYHDKTNQRFVIGHIGDHLRDKSTR